MRRKDYDMGRAYGTHRWVTKFLFLPLKIRDERRWLEKTTWLERWTRGKYGDFWEKIFWKGKPPREGDKDDYLLSSIEYLRTMRVIRDEVKHIEMERNYVSSRNT